MVQRETHRASWPDPLTLQALDELNGNPLEASLNVRANDPSHYQAIATYLTTADTASGDAGKIIDKAMAKSHFPRSKKNKTTILFPITIQP